MLIANVLSAQVQVSDTLSKNRFQVRINGTIKGNYSKGSCYADANSAGNIAIKFSGNDKLVTAYQAPSLYVINGQTSSNRDSVLNRLHIIMLDFQCSTPEPPIETFAYCGAPVWDFWSSEDSGNNSDTLALCGGSNSPLCISSNEAIIHFWNSGVSYPTYNFGECLGGIICSNEIETCQSLNGNECAEIVSFTTLIGGETFTDIDSTTNCESGLRAPQSIIYTFDAALNDTFDLNAVSITISADTTIKNDIFIAQSVSALRVLGVAFTNIDLDTTNATIEITAKPVKTSGQTYAASSFKIEKITYADISAGIISGSSYNPNSGTQTDTFALTTGKNTFKVSVEDTDGNIAYSIFQVTKTLL